jgi:hypothetical protein
MRKPHPDRVISGHLVIDRADLVAADFTRLV